MINEHPHNNDPIREVIARSRSRRARFDSLLAQLRAGDPTFAEASALYPADMGEWQGAVYLATGCGEVWRTLGAEILADRSIGPIVHEIDKPRRPWSGSETDVLRWAAHLWDVGRRTAAFPYSFDEFYFQRWITALHLRKTTPPALWAPTIATAGR